VFVSAAKFLSIAVVVCVRRRTPLDRRFADLRFISLAGESLSRETMEHDRRKRGQ